MRRSVAYRLRHSSATPPVKTETTVHAPSAHARHGNDGRPETSATSFDEGGSVKTEARRRAGAATAGGVTTIAWAGGTSAAAAAAATATAAAAAASTTATAAAASAAAAAAASTAATEAGTCFAPSSACAAAGAASCSCCCLAMHSLLTHRVGNRGGGCTGVREKSVSQWNSHAQSLTQWKPCSRMKVTTSACSA